MNNMLSFLKEIIISIVDGSFGQIIAGLFVLTGAWYVFTTENNKVIITKKHEIALNQLIPNVYNPLLNILDEYEDKRFLGWNARIDTGKVLEIIEKNSCLLFFAPEDIQKCLESLRKLVFELNQKSELTDILETKIVEELLYLRERIKFNFRQYIL
jgi:hypothetical protein